MGQSQQTNRFFRGTFPSAEYSSAPGALSLTLDPFWLTQNTRRELNTLRVITATLHTRVRTVNALDALWEVLQPVNPCKIKFSSPNFSSLSLGYPGARDPCHTGGSDDDSSFPPLLLVFMNRKRINHRAQTHLEKVTFRFPQIGMRNVVSLVPDS